MSMDMSLGVSDPLVSRGSAHPNPMFDFLTGFVPRKLKDLFKWAEYLAFNSAHIYAVIKKFGEYPITKFVYEDGSPIEKERHKDLFEKTLRMKGFLTKVSFDKWLYGNSFVSIYEPFKRNLVCSHCKVMTDIKMCKNYEFNLDKLLFHFRCPACRQRVVGKLEDAPLTDKSRLRLIRWDPKAIEITPNPFTGECLYYYTVPRSIVQQVRAGNKHLINTTPYEFLVAMQKEKTFLFEEDQLYHMKVPGPAGVESHWGFPPITAAIKLFLFAAILRRANEAIALEHITPFRVMFPQASSGNGDPLTSIPLDEWREKLERSYKDFRKDPLQIMFAPTAIGVQNIGGEGRAMLTLGELQEAEKNIVLSMGVPMEFITGGLGQTRGEITLRMIENQLQTHIEDLNDLSQWVEKKCASFLGWQSVIVRLADFKMIDDIDRKNFFLQLWQQQKVSDTTMYEMFEINPVRERKQRKEDTLADARAQQELQAEVSKLQNSLSNKSQQQAAQQAGKQSYDTQEMVAQADQMVQDLMQYDQGTRRSRLDSLKGEDIVMYALTKERLEQAGQDQAQAAKSEQK